MDFVEAVNYTEMDSTGEEPPLTSVYRIFQEVVFTILLGVGVIIDATAIYTINHFKKLRTTTNLLFSNWAIADILGLLANPSSFRIIALVDDSGISVNFMCSIIQIGFVFHNVGILFMILISIDWCLASYYQNKVETFRKCCTGMTIVIWCVSVIDCVIVVKLCLKRIANPVTLSALVICYLFLVLLLLLMHVLKCVQNVRKVETSFPTVMLTIPTTYTLCWLVGFTIFLFSIILSHFHKITFLAECVVYSSTIAIFTLMYKYNKDFQACLVQLLKRRKAHYTENITELDQYGENLNNM